MVVKFCDYRRGEEYFFIFKLVILVLKRFIVYSDKFIELLRFKVGNRAVSMWLFLKVVEGKKNLFFFDKYVVLVFCRCNYFGNFGYL